MDGAGADLATGAPPRWPGWPDPATALAAAPVARWPLGAVAEDGRRTSLARSLGPGGERVEGLLGALTGSQGTGDVDVTALARATPAGEVGLPMAALTLPQAVAAAAEVDPAWLRAVDHRRTRLRRAVQQAGRDTQMEAALNVTMLIATERLDPADDTDVDAHVASGAQLWLLAGAVVSALAGARTDPFAPWARLVAAGWWPVGPSGGRLVVSRRNAP